MQYKDYYKILGVEKNATADDIKKAYRKLVRKYHPDVSKAADASERTAEINEAYDVLSDPEKRQAYDSIGRGGQTFDGQNFQPPPDWDYAFNYSIHGAETGEFSDFFEQLFGRARSAHSGGRTRGFDRSHASMRGDDQYAKIELDIADAYRGAERILTLHHLVFDERGQPVTQEHQLNVKIPKGVYEGQHIRLAGRGNPGIGGGPAGDLLLEVQFKADPRWRAEGRDIYQRLQLAPWEAALGASVTVMTPTGETKVTVPANSRAHQKLRLKERGIPGSPPGHLYLELDIACPAADTEQARQAYAEFAKAFPSFNPRAGGGR